jgi:FtsP/CotA-like multicopper oxidase with cupredoxin domain
MPNRRQFLERAGAVTTAAIIGRACAVAEPSRFGVPLPIPELRDARASGGNIDLIAAEGLHAFRPGRPTATYGFSAPYLGPVLVLHSGDDVQISVENRLGRNTTAHWHGVLAPAAVDGGPHIIIEPGETWRPTLSINQPETTAWYHAHPHGESGRQVYMGLAGMVIIKDGSSEKLGLPYAYGVDDLPIILQDGRFDRDGALLYAPLGPGRLAGMRGDRLIVNGAVAPVAKAPSGIVRLRLLNAANARNFNLAFSDDRTFHVIASDGGYLPAPIAMTALTIAPGERFEVLVNFSDGRSVQLVTAADTRGMTGMMGMAPGMGPGMMRGVSGGGAGILMRFDVDPSLPAPVKSVPSTLVALPQLALGGSISRRQISLDMGPAMMMGGMMRQGRDGMGRMGMGPPVGINGRVFDMNRIDFEPKLGSSEIWEVTPSMMAHPFHVHGVIFRVLSIGGAPPAPHLAGGKDTILLDGPAELLMQFTQPATRSTPFMFHCHILEHEDAGMMGQFATS